MEGGIAFTVRDEDDGTRLDRALQEAVRRLPGDLPEDGDPGDAPQGPSRESLKRAVVEGLCTRNGVPCMTPSARLRAGDVVEFVLPEDASPLVPEDGPLTVLWKDRDLAVCDKPAGLTVHPCPSCPSGTLLQRLLRVCPEVASMGGLRPGIVHRIDKETSGLLAVARTEGARLAMSEAFAERRVGKRYLALVSGRPPDAGTVDRPVGRDPRRKTRMACLDRGGREARTDWERLWSAADGSASLLAVRIHTGRTHQIRVHMSSLGHPLLGDALYGGRPMGALAPRVMLHAWELSFAHPRTGRTLSFRLPPPPDFRERALALSRETLPLVVTGNPGCGKSTLLRLLRERGVPTASADDLVSGYYGPGGEAASWLSRRFGPDILAEDGSADRRRLMALFEASPRARRETEEFCHALVKGDVRAFFAGCARRRESLAAAEIPLWFESGWNAGAFDPAPLAVGVRAGRAVREARLASSRGWTAEKSAAIEAWQWDEERKMAACDETVDNSSTPEALAREVDGRLAPRLEALLEERRRASEEAFGNMWGTLLLPGGGEE